MDSAETSIAAARCVAAQWVAWASVHGGAGDGSVAGAPCVPNVCRAVRVPVYGGGVDGGGGAAVVHRYCSQYCGCSSARQANRTVVTTLYLCTVHSRMHACTGERCDKTAYVTSLGFRVCCLSGRTLAAPTAHSFGDGTVMGASLSRPSSRPSRDAAGGAVKLVFGDARADNTFADGAAHELSRAYAAAYAAAETLVFGERRARMEYAAHAAACAEAHRAVRRHMIEESRAGRVPALDVCARVHARAMAMRIASCIVLLPSAASVRALHAYYALRCTELYFYVCAARDDVLAAAPSGSDALDVAARVGAYTREDVMPVLLGMLQHGVYDGTTAVAPRDPLISVPDAHTLEALGVRQRQCTAVKRDVKRLIECARDCGAPLPVGTVLPLAHVLRMERGAVLRAFLDERRRNSDVDLGC